MLKRRVFAGICAAAALSVAGLGCGGGSSAPKLATVTPADMPEGADWTGVYFDALYGYFHIVQEGKTVPGKWERSHKDKWGELHGVATGNVLKFTWTEDTVGAVGPAAQRDGKGYFVYSRPAGENVDDEIAGEIGRGQDELGEKLKGVKQRLKMPDLGSIGGTGATDIGGGDWDSDKKEEGTPEPPAPSPPP